MTENTLFTLLEGHLIIGLKKRGKIKDFDQQGAEFLTIPLVQAMDARQIVDAIGRHISGI